MISLDLNHPRFLDFWKAVESILFWWLAHWAWNPWISSVLPTGHDRETAAFGCPIHALFLFLFFFFLFPLPTLCFFVRARMGDFLHESDVRSQPSSCQISDSA